MGLTWVLDRRTGEPLFEIEERAVPQTGAVDGEYLAATQPFPVKPDPLHQLTFGPDDAWGVTGWDRNACREKIEALDHGPIYTPISIMMDEDFFCTETPCCVTAVGSCGSARLTRFCTCTWAMSGSVSREKYTVIVNCPVAELVDVIYSMLSTPLICASMGAATESARGFESAPERKGVG